eukprot:TRINITY_DN18881_c0_g2_i1.p2 TRINITY_DN18881_c0_g2~~TRINITY_DN18881_c0_g2_i1.p2  ORF type:complete len:567 (+),score=185.69 TRINITY_DN18881_c0_g2_i1:81-1781(+)
MSAMLVYVHDAQGVWRYLSLSVTAFLGVTREELLGKSYAENVPGGQLGSVDYHTQKTLALTPPAVNSYELALRHRDGRDLWIRVYERPVDAPDGERGVAGIAFAVGVPTDAKEMARDMQDVLSEASVMGDEPDACGTPDEEAGAPGVIEDAALPEYACSAHLLNDILSRLVGPGLSVDEAALDAQIPGSTQAALRRRRMSDARQLPAFHEQWSPRGAAPDSGDVDKVVASITDHYARRLKYNAKEDRFADLGRDIFMQKVRNFVVQGKPVEMVLPAFPFKSRNHALKTLGDLPDKGEELALMHLHNYCQAASQRYPPGVRIVVVSDGRVYNDLFHVPDAVVADYDRCVRQMMQDSDYIRWDDLSAVGTDLGDSATRQRLLERYGVTHEAVDRRIRSDTNFAAIYCGFQVFVREDLFSCMDGVVGSDQDGVRHWPLDGPREPTLSATKIKRMCKQVAREMMLRNEAYTGYIAERYPDAVRLSIHAHDNRGPKFSVNMLGDAAAEEARSFLHIPTPWHNVTVELDDGVFRVMRRCKVGLLSGSPELVRYPDGRPSHYRVSGLSPDSPR